MKSNRAIVCYALFFLFGSWQSLHATERPKLFAPLVDHHQHLLSPAGAALVNHSLPLIEPSELDRLLKERAERWNDQKALSELYFEDSLFLKSYCDTEISCGTSVEIMTQSR